MSIWQHLGLDGPTSDRRLVKKAYARALKRTNPEDDAEAFERLRSAYDIALRHVDSMEVSESLPVDSEKKPSLDQDAALQDELSPVVVDQSNTSNLNYKSEQNPLSAEQSARALWQIACQDPENAVHELVVLLQRDFFQLDARNALGEQLVALAVDEFDRQVVAGPFILAILQNFDLDKQEHPNHSDSAWVLRRQHFQFLVYQATYRQELSHALDAATAEEPTDMAKCDVLALLLGHESSAVSWHTVVLQAQYSRHLREIFHALSGEAQKGSLGTIPRRKLEWLGADENLLAAHPDGSGQPGQTEKLGCELWGAIYIILSVLFYILVISD